MGDELGKKLLKCKLRQAPTLLSFLAVPASSVPTAWHPQHPRCSAFAPWFSWLQLCPVFLHPGRARAGFGPVCLGLSLASRGLHWSGMPGNTWEGRDEQRCGSHLGDGYFVGVKVPCPGLTLCFLEAVSGSGCSTAPRGDQHMLSPLPQLSPGGNCISPAATCAGGGFIAPLGGGALGTLHCFNPPLCLA